MRSVFLACLGLYLMTGCSETVECAASYKDKGGPEIACVPTSSTAATSGCFEKAQICPDLAPIQFCTRSPSSSNPVNLTIDNRGETPMKITGIKVRGDTRCVFKRAQLAPLIGTSIEPGRSMIVRFFYEAPAEAGTDHALIEIDSDAENYPKLLIPVCGKSGGNDTMCLPCEDRTTAEYTECFEQT